MFLFLCLNVDLKIPLNHKTFLMALLHRDVKSLTIRIKPIHVYASKHFKMYVFQRHKINETGALSIRKAHIAQSMHMKELIAKKGW